MHFDQCKLIVFFYNWQNLAPSLIFSCYCAIRWCFCKMIMTVLFVNYALCSYYSHIKLALCQFQRQSSLAISIQ